MKFYDANSPDSNSGLEDKSSIYVEEQTSLCDFCQNVILVPIKDNRLKYEAKIKPEKINKVR